MRAASPGESELEYEDIESSDMDNDNNDDLELMEKGKKSKAKSRKLSKRKQKKSNSQIYQEKMNDISVCEDSDEEQDESKSDPKSAAADADVFSDSTDDGMSMARMREEYYKSQTLSKKFTDLLEDIREVLKSGQMQVQHKLTKKKPMIVVPMAMPSQSQVMQKKEKTETPQNGNVAVEVKVSKSKLLDGQDAGQVEQRQDNVDREDEHSVESECEEKFDENSHGRKG